MANYGLLFSIELKEDKMLQMEDHKLMECVAERDFATCFVNV